MQIERTVKPIQKKEYPDVTCPFNSPTQSKASSNDVSEKGNKHKVIFAANSNFSEMASTRDCINVKKNESEDDAMMWIGSNVGIIAKVTGDGNGGYCPFIGACNNT